MFDKMVKMKNKKGFTLVEMLVVIAIIAVLTSVIVPVIGTSTAKSRAATNAANLRAIEGQLSVMRVENPELFESAVERLGSYLGEYEAGIDLFARLFLDMSLEELLADDNVFSQYARYKLYHSTATADGTLTISDGEGHEIVLEDVPAAVGISIPGMEVAEGTPMTVYISDTGLAATYEYGGASFGRLDFAEVAETGEYTGNASSGLTEEEAAGNVENYLQCTLGIHDLDENCKCTRCSTIDHSADDTHNCTECGTLVNKAHKDERGGGFLNGEPNGDCDYSGCDVCLHQITTIDGITKCKFCGVTKCDIDGTNHSFTKAVCTVCGFPEEHDCVDADKDHSCDKCGKVMSEHSFDSGKYKHDCSYCGAWHFPSWQSVNSTTHECTADGCNASGTHVEGTNWRGQKTGKCESCGTKM